MRGAKTSENNRADGREDLIYWYLLQNRRYKWSYFRPSRCARR